MYDGRPNGELVLATGALEDRNPADCQIVQVWALRRASLRACHRRRGTPAPQTAPLFSRGLKGACSYRRAAAQRQSLQLRRTWVSVHVCVLWASERALLRL